MRVQAMTAGVLVGVLLGSASLSGWSAATEAPCDEVILEGVGPACREGALWRVFLEDGSSVLTHGPDAPPPDLPPIPSTTDLLVPPVCVDPTLPGVDHARNVLVYARAFDQADRYAAMTPALRHNLLLANTWLWLDGAQRGMPVSYRTQCDADLQPLVLNAILATPRASTSAGTIFSNLRTGGFNNPDVKYMIWFDGSACGCGGIGTINGDDRLIAGNVNNVGPDWGITFGYTGFNGAFILMHENGHNQGVVQLTAPHTSGGWHCNDGYDVMCYADGGSRSNYTHTACAYDAVGNHPPFDCNGDDYFHPLPQPDNYLFSHWNMASPYNRFVSLGSLGRVTAPAPAP